MLAFKEICRLSSFLMRKLQRGVFSKETAPLEEKGKALTRGPSLSLVDLQMALLGGKFPKKRRQDLKTV
jgi:hypothetical protein